MINPVLDIAQLKSVITIVFEGKSLRIDRILKNTGKHKKSCWVSYWNEAGERWSTFISKADLLSAFWQWFNTVRIFYLNHNDRLHLGWAVYIALNPGEAVFKRNSLDLGVVLDKRLVFPGKYPEILVAWGGEERWEKAVWLEAF